MAFSRSMQEKLIRYTIHPFFRNKQISFKTHLKNSRTILISLPGLSSKKAATGIVNTIHNVFQGKKIVLISDNCNKELYAGFCTNYLEINNFDLLKDSRMPSIKEISDMTVNVFLDLNPDLKLLNIFLCKQLRADIRISFRKDYSEHYYNFEYGANKSEDIELNILNLIHFIEKFQ